MARSYFELFETETREFTKPLWTVPGNHDHFGIIYSRSKIPQTHPLYDRAMYRYYRGPDYYSFTYGGVHFVGLNTIDNEGPSYYGHVDSLQLAWLARDLARIPATMPVVTFNHIPFVTSVDAANGYREDGPAPTLLKVGGQTVFRHVVSNFGEVLPILQARDWPLALAGHIHTRETIQYSSPVRTRFHQAAAVLGPTDSVLNAISGVTVYRVQNRVIDDGEFVPLR